MLAAHQFTFFRTTEDVVLFLARRLILMHAQHAPNQALIHTTINAALAFIFPGIMPCQRLHTRTVRATHTADLILTNFFIRSWTKLRWRRLNRRCWGLSGGFRWRRRLGGTPRVPAAVTSSNTTALTPSSRPVLSHLLSSMSSISIIAAGGFFCFFPPLGFMSRRSAFEH